jgi:hypothetical protein
MINHGWAPPGDRKPLENAGTRFRFNDTELFR